MTDPMLPSPFVVQRTVWETDDTFTLELTPGERVHELPFSPGQFNMLYALGVGEVPISISGDPADRARYLHTIRAVGPATAALGKIRDGDEIGLRGPYGSSWPTDFAREKDVVIVAGGIGLAPLRPAIYELGTHRQKYWNINLLYGARTPSDILYAEELNSWGERFDINVSVIVDQAPRGWAGDVGVVTRLLARADFDPFRSVAMVCGPEIMMTFTIMGLSERNMADQNIFVSMERNMKCAVGFCGHCQYGPMFVCKDGPVLAYERLRPWLPIRGL